MAPKMPMANPENLFRIPNGRLYGFVGAIEIS
jgi:hypothetical protein